MDSVAASPHTARTGRRTLRVPLVEARQRVIPTCTGNSARSSTDATSGACHPCVCRERCFGVTVKTPAGVSSLRVRVITVRVPPTDVVVPGGIPACAGNRLGGRRRPAGDSCHPCVCGEGRRWKPGCSAVTCHPCVCGEGHGPRLRAFGVAVSSLRVRGGGSPKRVRCQRSWVCGRSPCVSSTGGHIIEHVAAPPGKMVDHAVAVEAATHPDTRQRPGVCRRCVRAAG